MAILIEPWSMIHYKFNREPNKLWRSSWEAIRYCILNRYRKTVEETDNILNDVSISHAIFPNCHSLHHVQLVGWTFQNLRTVIQMTETRLCSDFAYKHYLHRDFSGQLKAIKDGDKVKWKQELAMVASHYDRARNGELKAMSANGVLEIRAKEATKAAVIQDLLDLREVVPFSTYSEGVQKQDATFSTVYRIIMRSSNVHCLRNLTGIELTRSKAAHHFLWLWTEDFLKPAAHDATIGMLRNSLLDILKPRLDLVTSSGDMIPFELWDGLDRYRPPQDIRQVELVEQLTRYDVLNYAVNRILPDSSDIIDSDNSVGQIREESRESYRNAVKIALSANAGHATFFNSIIAQENGRLRHLEMMQKVKDILRIVGAGTSCTLTNTRGDVVVDRDIYNAAIKLVRVSYLQILVD